MVGCRYYAVLEEMLLTERERLQRTEPDAGYVRKLATLLKNEQFHRALFACSCELVCNQRGTAHILEFADFVHAVHATPFEVCKVLAILMVNYRAPATHESICFHLRRCEEVRPPSLNVQWGICID
jgi:hypothetical protein